MSSEFEDVLGHEPHCFQDRRETDSHVFVAPWMLSSGAVYSLDSMDAHGVGTQHLSPELENSDHTPVPPRSAVGTPLQLPPDRPHFQTANLSSFLAHPSRLSANRDNPLTTADGQHTLSDQGNLAASLKGSQPLGRPRAILPGVVNLSFHTGVANTSTWSPPPTDLVPQPSLPASASGAANPALPSIPINNSLTPIVAVPDGSVAPSLAPRGSTSASLITSASRAKKRSMQTSEMNGQGPRQSPEKRLSEGVKAGEGQVSASHLQSSGKQTGIDWATWTETISHFFIMESHTAPEVSFEMSALYGVQIS